MTYTLQIDLKGADKVESVVSGLREAVGQLKGGGGGFAMPQIVSREQVTQITNATRGIAGMKKEVQSLATAAAQGLSSSGRAWMTAGFGSKSSAFQSLNPHMAAIMASLAPQGIVKGLRDVGGADLAKVFAMGSLGGGIAGLRDVGGADLAKVAALGAFGASTIKALRQTGGADLAKVFAMGSFDDAISASSIASQGVPPKLNKGSGFSFSSIPFIGKFLTIAGASALALEAFRKSVELVTNSMNQGFGIYSGAGQSGLSRGFFAQRQALADIFGVQGNPNQVFMFGQAVTEMQKRISDATKILASNSPQLAALHINLSVLKLDFEALVSSMASKIVPFVNIFLAAMDVMVKKMQQYAADMVASAMVIGHAEFIIALGTIAKNTNPNVAAFLNPSAPSLLPFMKQLPASSWERMGLVIGGGFGNNNIPELTRQIAKNTGGILRELMRGRMDSNNRNPSMARSQQMPGP